MMTVRAHHSRQELLERANRETRPKVARRIQILADAQKGLEGAEIAEHLGVSLSTVERWVRRYNAEGIEGLADRPRPGAPTKLPRDQEAAFCERLDAGASDDDPVSVLHGPQIRHILEHEFGASYSLPGVYDLLHRLGYSWLCPRPRHEQADPAAQEAFKKTSTSGSMRSGRSTRTSGSRCGSRTRPASASTGPTPGSGPAPAAGRGPSDSRSTTMST